MHLTPNILVTGCKLLAEEIQDGKVDLIGTMRIRRMHGGLHVADIVVHQVEDIVTFVFVGTNDVGIDWNMVGNQGDDHNALLQAEVFGGMTCIEGVNEGFKLLPITAGMHLLSNVVVAKDR